MKYFSWFILSAVIMLSFSCETVQDEINCYPTRIKRTMASGAGADQITADYKYNGNLVDRIVFSNSQTHYYLYDSSERLIEIERVNVARYQKEELHFTYAGEVMQRIDEYMVSLDFTTQEDLDTIYNGYYEFTLEGDRIVREDVFRPDSGGSDHMVHAFRKDYGYDSFGNLIEYDVTNVQNDSLVESYTMTYDLLNHPYSSMKMIFDETSHVNNLLTRTDNLSGETLNYQVLYNASSYPEQVNVKQDSYLKEVITYTYECR